MTWHKHTVSALAEIARDGGLIVHEERGFAHRTPAPWQPERAGMACPDLVILSADAFPLGVIEVKSKLHSGSETNRQLIDYRKSFGASFAYYLVYRDASPVPSFCEEGFRVKWWHLDVERMAALIGSWTRGTRNIDPRTNFRVPVSA